MSSLQVLPSKLAPATHCLSITGPSRVSPPRMLPSRVDFLHAEAEAFTQIISTHESYTHYTQKLLLEEVFTQSSF